ncbi:MAG: PGPGW domain-containing protein [Actinomycetota bacterium]
MDTKKLGREPRWLKHLSPAQRKVVTGVIGALLIAGGAAVSVVPGPLSIPLVLAGLTVLSWEYTWARNGRRWLVTKFHRFKEWREARKARKAGEAGDRTHRRVA